MYDAKSDNFKGTKQGFAVLDIPTYQVSKNKPLEC
jgi:hypothetical protein